MATTKEPVKKEVKPTAHPAHPAAKAPAHRPAHATPAAPTGRAVHAASAATAPKGRYTEATGRRKTAIARVRMSAGDGKVIVNGKDLKHYFSLDRLVASAISPLTQLNLAKNYDVSVHVSGGGTNAQAEAIRHGLSRAIVEIDVAWKPRLRAMGYMTRDSRMVERKKYGLRKARRAPQWAKR